MAQSKKHNSFTINSLGVSSLSVYYVGYEQCQPGHSWGPGMHDHYLLHHIRSGFGILQIDNKEYKLHTGDTFISRPGNTLYYCADDQDPWSYCWIGFSGSECANLLAQSDFSTSEHVIHTDFGTELSNCILSIYAQRGPVLADTLQMTSGLYQLMACLIRHSTNHQCRSTYKQISVHQVAEYISSHISYPLTIHGLANYANMSQSGLYRAFTEHLGMGPMKYVEAQRMRRACQLLQATDMSVLSVAYSVGFSNGQYFARCFRKFMGMSPSEFALLSRTSPDSLPTAPFLPDIP